MVAFHTNWIVALCDTHHHLHVSHGTLDMNFNTLFDTSNHTLFRPGTTPFLD